jgi:TolB-like protein/Tfp pilus assembly protein PilF
VLQHYGDGTLSIFGSAIDAIHCTVEIQRQLQQHPKVDVRIGIHTGDVMMDEGTIYGDGVNLASRLESLAVPGSILVSEKVYDEVKNQEDIRVHELGFFEFKNVRQPVRVFAISSTGMVVPARTELQGKTHQPQNRLAVLPFVNMSPDPDNEYFSDGITEEILNALTKVDGLQVTSRTSVFAFKGKQEDIRDIAITLNVDKVLEGSVRKAGNRVRITAQLINAADGYHLWSETYDRNLNDIFEVQDEISGIIANKLRENLSNHQKSQTLVKPSTQNIEAYTHYLKGLHFLNKMTPADSRRAITSFEQAISIEPRYALAYAMTAAAYSELGAMGQMMPKRAFELAHQYADKALEFDDSIAESHIAKAGAYLFYDWKFDSAFQELQKGRQINPNVTSANQLLSFYYIMMGKKEEAIEIMEEAVRLDPLSPIMNNQLGNVYVFAERYDDAIRQADKLLEINPQMRSSIELKGWATGMRGDWQSALKLFEEVHRLTNHPLKGLMGLGYSHAMVGNIDKAMECIHKLEQRHIEEPDSVVDGDLVAVWLAVGNFDKVFYHIHQCIEKRTSPINFFLQYPPFKVLRNDPRYHELASLVVA